MEPPDLSNLSQHFRNVTSSLYNMENRLRACEECSGSIEGANKLETLEKQNAALQSAIISAAKIWEQNVARSAPAQADKSGGGTGSGNTVLRRSNSRVDDFVNSAPAAVVSVAAQPTLDLEKFFREFTNRITANTKLIKSTQKTANTLAEQFESLGLANSMAVIQDLSAQLNAIHEKDFDSSITELKRNVKLLSGKIENSVSISEFESMKKAHDTQEKDRLQTEAKLKQSVSECHDEIETLRAKHRKLKHKMTEINVLREEIKETKKELASARNFLESELSDLRESMSEIAQLKSMARLAGSVKSIPSRRNRKNLNSNESEDEDGFSTTEPWFYDKALITKGDEKLDRRSRRSGTGVDTTAVSPLLDQIGSMGSLVRNPLNPDGTQQQADQLLNLNIKGSFSFDDSFYAGSVGSGSFSHNANHNLHHNAHGANGVNGVSHDNENNNNRLNNRDFIGYTKDGEASAKAFPNPTEPETVLPRVFGIPNGQNGRVVTPTPNQQLVNIIHPAHQEMKKQIRQNTMDIDELIESLLNLEDLVRKKADLALVDTKASTKYCQELVFAMSEAISTKIAGMKITTSKDLETSVVKVVEEVKRVASRMELTKMNATMAASPPPSQKNMNIKSILFQCQACHQPVYEEKHSKVAEVKNIRNLSDTSEIRAATELLLSAESARRPITSFSTNSTRGLLISSLPNRNGRKSANSLIIGTDGKPYHAEKPKSKENALEPFVEWKTQNSPLKTGAEELSNRPVSPNSNNIKIGVKKNGTLAVKNGPPHLQPITANNNNNNGDPFYVGNSSPSLEDQKHHSGKETKQLPHDEKLFMELTSPHPGSFQPDLLKAEKTPSKSKKDSSKPQPVEESWKGQPWD